jgi:hypothetical protein
MTPDTLAFVPTEELKAEILQRSDVAILITCTRPVGTVDAISWVWKGDYLKVLGLLEEVKPRVLEAERREQHDAGGIV